MIIVHILSFLILRKIKKFSSGRKRDVGDSVHGNLVPRVSFCSLFSASLEKRDPGNEVACKATYYSRMQIMTAKTTTIQTLYVHVSLNGMTFPKFFMILLHIYARDLNF